MDQRLTLASHLEKVTPGTGAWLFQDEQFIAWVNGVEMQNWMMPGGTTVKTINKIWLYGPSGSGLTMTSSMAADFLIKQKAPNSAVAYYFCGHLQNELHLIDVVKELTAQVAQQNAAAKKQYKACVDDKKMPELAWINDTEFNKEDPNHWAMLLVSMSTTVDRLFVVLEHADVMPAPPLHFLSSLVDTEKSTIRMMVTTSDGPGQQALCMETMSCPIAVVASDQDICLYIEHELEKLNLPEWKDSLKAMQKLVTQRANGRWLWASADFRNRCDLLRRGLPIDEDSGMMLSHIFFNHLKRVLDNDPVSNFILLTATRFVCAAHSYTDIQLTVLEMCAVLSTLLFQSGIYESPVSVEEVERLCSALLRRSLVLNSFVYTSGAAHDYLVRDVEPAARPLDQLFFNRRSFVRVFADLNEAAVLLKKTNAEAAESILKKIHICYFNSFGPTDKDTLEALAKLGDFYTETLQYEDAEKAFGFIAKTDNRPLALDATNALAILYKRQQQFSEAEMSYQLAISGHEADRNDEEAAKVTNNLAMMYAAKGEHAQAQRVWEKLLKNPHGVDTLMVEYNLALTYKFQERFEEAASHLETSLIKYEDAKGPHHPLTIDAADALAHVYGSMRRFEEAEGLFKRVVESYMVNGGPQDAATLEAKHNLAKVYQDQGRLEDAKDLLQQVLRDSELSQGWSLAAVKVGFTLFFLLDDMGLLAESARLGAKVYMGYETHLGKDDKETVSTADCLGLVYAKLGRLNDAEKMWKNAFEGYRATRGETDGLTCAAAHNLGLVYTKLGNGDARAMLELALRGYQNDEDMRRRVMDDLDALP